MPDEWDPRPANEGADRRTAMEAVVRRLQGALAAIGAAPLGRPEGPTALDEVTAAIAPLGLPVEVDQFWRLVNAGSSTVTCFPHPRATDPAFALDCWREHQQQPGMTPDPLLGQDLPHRAQAEAIAVRLLGSV